nr:hypothetical protein [Tanacetum cinerariifolium]
TGEELKEMFINEAKVLAVVEEDRKPWMIPIYNYLTEETLLAEKKRQELFDVSREEKFMRDLAACMPEQGPW